MLVISGNSMQFIKAVNTSGESKTGAYICHQLSSALEQVGAKNVIQVRCACTVALWARTHCYAVGAHALGTDCLRRAAVFFYLCVFVSNMS